MSDTSWSAFDEVGRRSGKVSATVVPATETDPFMFMTTENITRADLSTALREYRALDSYLNPSPWEQDECNVLTHDFINWYRWERL